MESTVIQHYEAYDEDGRLERDHAHRIEFLTTIQALEGLIPDHSSILDCGAGTGKYSFYFAEKGHRVTALDLSPKNVEIIKNKYQQLGEKPEMHILQGTALDLSAFDNNSFDIVLCMGPMYHLREDEDRRLCLEECLRVLKKDGLLVVAYINKHAAFLHQFRTNMHYLNEALLNRLIHNKYLFSDADACFVFTTPDEIDRLLQSMHVQRIDHLSTDGIAYLLSQNVNHMDEDMFKLWCSYHYQTCREPSLLGYSLHGLYICKKAE